MEVEPHGNSYLTGDYNEETGYYEYFFKDRMEMYNLSLNNSSEYFLESDNEVLFNNIFWSINHNVRKNDLIVNKYTENFKDKYGITPEEAQNQYLEASTKAFGENELQEKLNKYVSDMDSYANKLSAMVSIGAIGLSFVWPPAGSAALVGAGLDNAIDGVNMASNETKNENWQALVKESLNEAALIGLGMGIGKVANSIGSSATTKLISSGMGKGSAHALGVATETLTDLTLSVGTDYILSGGETFNFEGNSLGVLINIASGIRGYKAIESIRTGNIADDTIPAKDINVAKDMPTNNDILTNNPKYASKIEEIEKTKHFRAKEVTDTYKKATESNDSIKIGRIDTAIDILKDGQTCQDLKNLSENLAKELSSNNYTKDELLKLYDDLGLIMNGDIKTTSDGILISNTSVGTISARAKSADSIYSKLRNKLLDLKIDVPKTNEEALKSIGDAQGLRIVLNDTDVTSENIGKITNLSGSKLESFEKYLKDKNSITLDSATSQEFAILETKLLEELRTEQTQDFVDRFATAIANGEQRITEIHNYSSKNGVPYLSKEQVTQLKNANKSWFDSVKAKIEAGEKTDFELKQTKEGIEYLLDTKTNTRYDKKIIVESIYDDPKAVKINGYTAAQFNLVSKTGQNIELQFRGSQVDSIAECEHIVYDITKNKETVAGKEYDEIRNAIKKLQANKEAFEEYQQYYNDVFMACRKKELGIDVVEPKISDYKKIVEILGENSTDLNLVSAEGVKELHDKIKTEKESLKNGNK